MVTSYTAAEDIEVLTSDFPIPGFGLVPINSFVLKGTEPILVDTGAVVQSAEFMPALRSVIDPSDLKWIWITHTDFDHMGSLHPLLAEYPKIRVMTTFLGMGIMSLSAPLPMDRVCLEPGETVTVGNRKLTAVRPRPSTTRPPPASTTTDLGRSSAPIALARSCRPFPGTPPSSPTATSRTGRCSGRHSIPRGCTRSTALPLLANWTASGRWTRS
jgi:hypothetical protein